MIYEYLTSLAKEDKTEIQDLMYRLNNISEVIENIIDYAKNDNEIGPFKDFAKYIADDFKQRPKLFKNITFSRAKPFDKENTEVYLVDSTFIVLKEVVFFYEPLVIQFNAFLRKKLQDDIVLFSRSLNDSIQML